MIEKYEFLAGGAIASFLMFATISIGIPVSNMDLAQVSLAQPSTSGHLAYEPIEPVESPPAAPLNATSTLNVAIPSVSVSWIDNSSNEEQFVVERMASSSYEVVAYLGANVTSFIDTSPVQNALNSYRISAVNYIGTSQYSNVTSQYVTAVILTVPVAPSNLVGTRSGDAAVLSWSDNATNEANYLVQRSPDFSTWTTIVTLGANATVFTDGTPVVNTYNYYRIAARNLAGTSGYSNAISVAGPGMPQKPTDVTATQEVGSVRMGWVDSSSNETGFDIHRSVGVPNGWVFVASVGENVTAWNDTAPATNTIAYYRVAAKNTYGTVISDPVSITYTAIAPPTAPQTPSATQKFSTSTGQYSVLIGSQDRSSDESGFIVERSTDAVTFVTIASIPAQPNVYSFLSAVDVNVLLGGTYYYRVSALSANGTGSSLVNSITLTQGVVSVPTNLVGQKNVNGISLSWHQPMPESVNSHEIERAFNSGAFSRIATAAFDFMVSTGVYQDQSAAAPGTYAYRVRAVSESYGFSSFSSTTQVVIAGTSTVPATPVGFSASAQTGGIALTWTDVATNETGYLIERSIGGGAYVSYASLAANKNSYLNSNATAGTSYSYRLTALGVSGNSASVVASAVTSSTKPAAPSGLVGSANGTTVSLSWTDNSGYETGFDVQRSTNGSSYTTVGSALAAPANGTVTFIHGNNQVNKTYYFRVVARNAFGTSAPSNRVTVRTSSQQ